MKNDKEPLEETTTIDTKTLALILAIFDMAKESDILPEICNIFQKNIYDELSSLNMWSEQQRNSLMRMIKINLGILNNMATYLLEEEDSNERDEQDDWVEIERENDEWFKCFSDEDEN